MDYNSDSNDQSDRADFAAIQALIIEHLYAIADESKSINDFDYSYSFENIASMVKVYNGVKDSENLLNRLTSIRDHNLSFNFSDRVKQGWRDAVSEVDNFINSL